MNKWNAIRKELEFVASSNNGILDPRAVVDYAEENKQSALHARFTWDDKDAAYEYRISQARQIIKTVKIKITTPENKVIQVYKYQSLTPDRKNGNGYRATLDILSSKRLRAQLLMDALKELTRIQEQYKELNELAEVFAAIKKAKLLIKG